jgi:hypothetical protein
MRSHQVEDGSRPRTLRRSLFRITGERADHELPVVSDRDELRARRGPQRALVAEVRDNGRWALQRNQIQ